MNNPKLKKVTPYRTAKLSRVLKLVFFTWFCTLLSLLIIYQNLNLIGSTFVLFLLIGLSTIVGFYIGNIFTQFYKEIPFIKLLFLPLYPYLILIVCNKITTEIKNLDSEYYLLIYGIGLIIVLPLLMYFDFKTIHYCENCKNSFKSYSIFIYRKISPYQVLSLLNNRQVFPKASALENDYSFPRYKEQESTVSVAVEYCPRCYNAIVSGLLTYKVGSFRKEQRNILFYSDIWQSGLFKEVFKAYLNDEN